ncbi:MAG TPA: triphosphoribosyl-dephospho-CoA synthase [Metabacillus sp.]|nr:triphosphoribosyl-dephospho-CoA synthase [Metabacillus sp.]
MDEKLFYSEEVARLAVASLIEEVELTPKPGLVDQRNTGAHQDLTLTLMKKSAHSLYNTFLTIAISSYGELPSQQLREKIANIGRNGEREMFDVTGGVNTHKGAIWSLGLLTSALAMGKGTYTIIEIAKKAGELARFPDRFCPPSVTNGKRVMAKYGVNGAKLEAEQGFPHILNHSLPTLYQSREAGMSENEAKLYALLSLITQLDDTCILHRGGMKALQFVKKHAAIILEKKELDLLYSLDDDFIQRNLSPGGSADLLAATLFIDKTAVKTMENKLVHSV